MYDLSNYHLNSIIVIMTNTNHKPNNNHTHYALQFVFARCCLFTTSRMLLIHRCPFLCMTQNIQHIIKFISVFNQLYAQNLFHNKLYFMPLHVSNTCAHHQEVKIVLHSLWYHHTYRWPSRVQVERVLTDIMQF